MIYYLGKISAVSTQLSSDIKLFREHGHLTVLLFALLAVDHSEMLSSCPEDEPMTPGEECLEAATDESLLETNPIHSPLQVFAGMGGLALIAERLPMLYPDVIQQVRLLTLCEPQSPSCKI